MKNKYLISVIVATYNPIWEKLRSTLNSILCQKNIDFEILITDDGSGNNLFDKVKDLFNQKGFHDYVLLPDEINRGTCFNVYKGITVAKGKYIKLISPGDYLYTENVLYLWTRYMEDTGSKVCFGKSVYYHEEGGCVKVLKQYSYPQRTELYMPKKNRRKPNVLNYIMLADTPVGAAFCTEKEILKLYMKYILGKIKYVEDNIYRMMVILGEELVYFDENVIWYEYGTGISTNRSDKWARIVEEEIKTSFKCTLELLKETSCFNNRLRKYLLNRINANKGRQNVKYLLFPSLIIWKIKKSINIKYSDTDVDLSFISKISECQL